MFLTTFRFALIATATLMSQGAEAQTPVPVPDCAVIDACRATGLEPWYWARLTLSEKRRGKISASFVSSERRVRSC
jgi:hypothetical protein